jgi:hypothetical protein
MQMNRWVAGAAVMAAALMLWSCVLAPGRFDAALTVRKDGSFSYRYTGEIVLLTAASSMNAAAEEEEGAFEAREVNCSGGAIEEDDMLRNGYDDRACTPEELEERRRVREEERASRAEERKRELEMSKAMLGGLDPKDPGTMDEFARRLQGQEGWKRVVHKGDGVFDVQYEVAGRLDHAFVFPVFPQVDFIVPFVHASRGIGNRVRVSAPAFVQNSGAGFGALAGGSAQGGGFPGTFRKAEGTFTLTTDAAILTNNTQDGPVGPAAAKVLKWTIGPLDLKKPEALLQL